MFARLLQRPLVPLASSPPCQPCHSTNHPLLSDPALPLPFLLPYLLLCCRSFFVTQYYADYNSDNRVDALGYKESQYDKSFRGFNWDAAYRFSKGLTVSDRAGPAGPAAAAAARQCCCFAYSCGGWQRSAA